MLRPPLLTEAENWLGSRPLSTPDPTDLVRTFIAASRQAYDQEQAAIAQSQANLLALAGDAEGERGHSDTALKLCVHATREALRRGADPSRATAALAGAVCRWDWRLVLAGHADHVQSAAFSPDGTRIVTASWDKTARVWDAVSGQQSHVLRHEHIVKFAAFSPNGRRIVTASNDNTARIWSAASRQ